MSVCCGVNRWVIALVNDSPTDYTFTAPVVSQCVGEKHLTLTEYIFCSAARHKNF